MQQKITISQYHFMFSFIFQSEEKKFESRKLGRSRTKKMLRVINDVPKNAPSHSLLIHSVSFSHLHLKNSQI